MTSPAIRRKPANGLSTPTSWTPPRCGSFRPMAAGFRAIGLQRRHCRFSRPSTKPCRATLSWSRPWISSRPERSCRLSFRTLKRAPQKRFTALALPSAAAAVKISVWFIYSSRFSWPRPTRWRCCRSPTFMSCSRSRSWRSRSMIAFPPIRRYIVMPPSRWLPISTPSTGPRRHRSIWKA